MEWSCTYQVGAAAPHEGSRKVKIFRESREVMYRQLLYILSTKISAGRTGSCLKLGRGCRRRSSVGTSGIGLSSTGVLSKCGKPTPNPTEPAALRLLSRSLSLGGSGSCGWRGAGRTTIATLSRSACSLAICRASPVAVIISSRLSISVIGRSAIAAQDGAWAISEGPASEGSRRLARLIRATIIPGGVGAVRCRRIVGITISRRRSGLGCVIISLAEGAAGPSVRQPGIKTDSMEGMAASQATDVVVILKSVDANGTCVSRGCQKLGRNSSINVIVVLVVLVVMCSVGILSHDTSACLSLGERVFVLDTMVCIGRIRSSGYFSSSLGLIIRALLLRGNFGNDAFHASDATRSTGWRRYSSCRRQAILGAVCNPSLVLHHGEFFVDLIHSHELLLTTTTMRPSWHVLQVDRLPIFIQAAQLAVPSIIPEAVLNTNDNPGVLSVIFLVLHCQIPTARMSRSISLTKDL